MVADSEQTKQIAALVAAVSDLTSHVKAQDQKLAAQPKLIADMKDRYDVAASRSKRDRDMKPEKKSTAQQIDVIQAAVLSLKRAKRGLEDSVMQVPECDDAGVKQPLRFVTMPLTDLESVREAAKDLDQGIETLLRRESQLLVVFAAETNKIGYAAVEASDLCEGGGAMGHLEPDRLKTVKRVIQEAKELAKEAKREESKASKSSGGWGKGWGKGKGHWYDKGLRDTPLQATHMLCHHHPLRWAQERVRSLLVGCLGELKGGLRAGSPMGQAPVSSAIKLGILPRSARISWLEMLLRGRRLECRGRLRAVPG